MQDKIAKALQTSVTSCLGRGDDGTVFLLSDGRVLRKTTSDQEIAIALQLLELQDRNLLIPGMPLIDDVFWVEDHICINGESHPFKSRYIIRSAMDDIDILEIASKPSTWPGSLKCFNLGWTHNNQDYIDAAIDEQPILRDVYETLIFFKTSFDIKILDLGRSSNFGMIGLRLGIRDFSRAQVLTNLIERAQECGFKRIPLNIHVKQRTLR